jgi:hypothetical protein
VQSVMDFRYVRVGASLFTYQEDDWVQETNEGMDHAANNSYWEQISFRHPYRLRSRTRDLKLRSRPDFAPYRQIQRRRIFETDLDTDSTLEQSSDEESGSDSDEQRSPDLRSEEVSSPESLASRSENTISDPMLSEEDPSSEDQTSYAGDNSPVSGSSTGFDDSVAVPKQDGWTDPESASDDSSNSSAKSDGHGEWPVTPHGDLAKLTWMVF